MRPSVVCPSASVRPSASVNRFAGEAKRNISSKFEWRTELSESGARTARTAGRTGTTDPWGVRGTNEQRRIWTKSKRERARREGGKEGRKLACYRMKVQQLVLPLIWNTFTTQSRCGDLDRGFITRVLMVSCVIKHSRSSRLFSGVQLANSHVHSRLFLLVLVNSQQL